MWLSAARDGLAPRSRQLSWYGFACDRIKPIGRLPPMSASGPIAVLPTGRFQPKADKGVNALAACVSPVKPELPTHSLRKFDQCDLRSRNALVMTETELKLIANAAIMGESN